MTINEKAVKKIEEALEVYDRKTGHWILKIEGKAESGGTIGLYECSNCHKKAYATEFPHYFEDEKGHWHDPHFCPWCGSDNRKEGAEDDN